MTELPLPAGIAEKFASGELTTDGALDIEPPPEPRDEPAAAIVEDEPPVDVSGSLFRCRVCEAQVDGDMNGAHEPDCMYAGTRQGVMFA